MTREVHEMWSAVNQLYSALLKTIASVKKNIKLFGSRESVVIGLLKSLYAEAQKLETEINNIRKK